MLGAISEQWWECATKSYLTMTGVLGGYRIRYPGPPLELIIQTLDMWVDISGRVCLGCNGSILLI